MFVQAFADLSPRLLLSGEAELIPADQVLDGTTASLPPVGSERTQLHQKTLHTRILVQPLYITIPG